MTFVEFYIRHSAGRKKWTQRNERILYSQDVFERQEALMNSLFGFFRIFSAHFKWKDDERNEIECELNEIKKILLSFA